MVWVPQMATDDLKCKRDCNGDSEGRHPYGSREPSGQASGDNAGKRGGNGLTRGQNRPMPTWAVCHSGLPASTGLQGGPWLGPTRRGLQVAFCILCPSGLAECLRSWSLLLSRCCESPTVRVGEVQSADMAISEPRPGHTQVPAAARQRSGFVRRLRFRSGESASVLPHFPRTAKGYPSSHPSFPSIACHCHPFLASGPRPIC
jgi:hypothetical protein